MSKNIRSELWFTRLELENFRQYFGSHIINFSTDSSKHLTVVHAENSVGKTTMLNAMKWCLYGITPEFKDKVNLVCDKSDKNTCRVRLNFKYGELEYTALRVYDQKSRKSKLNLSTIDKKSRHQLPVNGSPEAEINNILPSELSNYFLFAGERYSQALDEANNTSHIKAIRDILGFTMSESVIADIIRLKKKNERKLSDLLSKNSNTQGLSDDLKTLLKDEEDYKKLKNELNLALIEQEGIKKTNLQKIIDSDDKKAKSLGEQERKLDSQKNQSVRHRDGFLKQKIKLISEYGYILFSAKLTSKNFDHIKVNHSSLPSPLADHFINKLIAEKECICGTPVLPDSGELKKLLEVRDSASTKIIQNRVLDAISQGDGFRKDSKAFMKNLRDIEGKLKTYNNQIGTIEKELQLTKKALREIGDVDVSQFQALLDAAETAISGILRQQGSLKSSIDSNKNQIAALKTKINQSKINPKETKKLENFDTLCTSLINRLNTYLTNHESKSINDIKDLVQTNIDESLRKGKEVILTPDYKFELMDKITKRIDQGADGGNGQTLLANLSFISALISTSKDRAKDTKKSIFVPGTIAPFVIDAPFAEMDKSYRLNTFEFLPKQSHQLIIFLSTGQWQDAYEDIIGKYIGKRYVLVNHDMTNNFSENTIKIKNKTHQLNVKSKDIDMSATTIEEI
jgi:DNA sulfur modification protein DndD